MKLELAASRFAVLCVLGTAVSGCSEYMDRKNTIAFSAGDAVQTNVVTHVIDPWPPYVQNTDIAFNGQRAQSAVEAYRCKKPQGEGGNANASASRGGAAFAMTINNNYGPTEGASKGGDGC